MNISRKASSIINLAVNAFYLGQVSSFDATETVKKYNTSRRLVDFA